MDIWKITTIKHMENKQQIDNPLGIWYPTSITLIVNGVEYSGYPTPMSLFSITLEWIRLNKL